MIGTTLAQFRITAKLGEGGMGEVYRAEDTKLGREVAIKVLPEDLTEDSERMARFEREAKVLASLNHPSIASIYDLAEVDGTHFLVLELVEGEDLDAVFQRGPLPETQALKIALQVADALDAAHSSGVVHRDLKPGNIMVGPEGQVKLLDFGLAKPRRIAGEIETTHSPTRTAPMTDAGAIMGTVGYMSPEQARGQPVGKQADIWAFGVVLWEMLTGKMLFEGDSVADLFVSVLQAEFDWDLLPKGTPTGIRRLLDRCLQREPRERLHDIADARIEIESVIEGEDETMAPPAPTSRRQLWPVVWIPSVLALLISGWIYFGPGRESERGELFRGDLVAPEGFQYGRVGDGPMKLSPSGDRLAYITAQEDYFLVVHDFSSGEIVTLQDRGDHTSFPFWSPDGQWVGFFADEKLKKIPAGGGPAQIVAEALAGRGGTWNRDGNIVFAPNIDSGLVKVSDSGGSTQPVTVAEEGSSHSNPHFLPDGRHFLFSTNAIGDSSARIAVGSIDGGDHTVLIEKGSNAQYADGYIFFARDRNLLAQPFDAGKRELTGPPKLLADAIDFVPLPAIGSFSVSESGLLVYRRSHARQTQVAWYGKDGVETVGGPGLFTFINSISADGSRIALVQLDETELYSDIWIMDMGRGLTTRATTISTPGEIWATLSDSGERLVVDSDPGEREPGGLWIQSTSSTSAREAIPAPSGFWLWDWSSDERYILGARREVGTRYDIYSIDLETDRQPRVVIRGRYGDLDPELSPDGRWLAFIGNETGQNELYVTDFPDGRSRWLASRASGPELRGFFWRWSRDGRTLYYFDQTGILEVPFEGTDPPTIGEPRMLFPSEDERYADLYWVFGVHDNRVLALKYASEPTVEPLRLIKNWQRLLEE